MTGSVEDAPDPGPEPRRVPVGEVGAAAEAVLLTTDEPVPSGVLAEVLGVAVTEVESALDAVSRHYEGPGHGFVLQHSAGGWQLATRPEYVGFVERHLGRGQQARLSAAALEALTIVAYRQPVTRGQVSSVRGVASDGVLRTLLARAVVEECGTDDSGALRYRTTPLFLDRLGLDSLDELPPLAPHLPDLAELEPTPERPVTRPDPLPQETP